MVALNPYLNFNGTTEVAFNFYKTVFGGEFAMLQRMDTSPEADKLSDADKNKIMHISLPLDSGNVLMGTDALESMGHPLVEGNNFSLSVSAASKQEADALYEKLAENGQSTMTMQNTFWGAYFGMCTDQFGIQWMVSFDELYLPSKE